MKYCAWCGKQICDDDVFCGWCGKRADGGDAPAAAPEAPPQPPVQQPWQAPQPDPWQQPAAAPAQPQWQAQPQQWQAQPQPQPGGQHAAPRSGGGKGALIGGIIAAVVVVAVLVGGFVWPGFFKKDKGDSGAIGKPGTEQTEAKPAKEPAAPKATEAPKETEAPKPIATPEPTPAPTEPPYVNTFTDVKEGDWYYDAVYWAGKNGVVTGTEFRPNDTATRAQALTFLWRAAGEPKSKLKASPYTDVTQGDWFYAPVLWGFENGLISAAADGQFHPGDSLTKAQAVTFLCRAKDGKPVGSEQAFWDARDTDWYFAQANWALEQGIIGRDDSYAFSPNATVSRAVLITMLHRAYDPNAKKANTTPPNKSGFADLGISADVDSHGQKSCNTYAKSKSTDQIEDVTFTAEVTDYRVFEADNGFPKQEGREYRVMTIHLVTKNAAQARTYYVGPCSYDCYNPRLYQDSTVTDGNGMETHTVIDHGVPAECTIWYRSESQSRDGYFHVDFTWTASVPVGYDGLVVGMYNRHISPSGRYLDEYYTSEDDFALFRMN